MIKLLCTSFVLFVLQLGAIVSVAPKIMHFCLQIPPNRMIFTDPTQRVVLFLTQELLGLSRQQAFKIVVVGGSTGREFFDEKEPVAEQQGVTFLNLSSSNQTLVDTLRLVDNIPDGAGAVILTYHPEKILTTSLEDIRLGYLQMGRYYIYPITSQAVRRLYKNTRISNPDTVLGLTPVLNPFVYYSRELASGFRENVNEAFSGNRQFGKLFINDSKLYCHAYTANNQITTKEVDEILDKTRNVIHETGPVDKNIENSIYILQSIADRCSQKNLDLVLFELPFSATYESFYKNEIPLVHAAMKKFLSSNKSAKQFSIPYADYKNVADIFYDHCHINDVGRRFFSEYRNTLLTSIVGRLHARYSHE